MERTALRTTEQVSQWFDGPQSPIMGFDWETTGLNYLEMQAVGVSFCDGPRSCYIDLWENGDYEDIMNILSLVFQSGKFVAHNLKFDWKCCNKFVGITPSDYFCTYIASYILDENRLSHSLNSLGMDYFGIGKTGKWEEFQDYHSESFYEYGMVDSEITYRLYELFESQIREEELEHVFQIEMDFLPVAAEIEMNGVLINQKALSELQCTVEKAIIESEDHMLSLVGKAACVENGLFGEQFRKSPVNFNSTAQLVECFQKLGLKLKEKTDNGAWSISSETLKRLKGDDFVDTLADYKSMKKLLTSYILPCWGFIDSDGRVRPNVGIVVSGRTSVSRPGLQQIPNVKDPSINYRQVFTTSGVMIGADYSGQELRILAEESQDHEMLRCFALGLNLHIRSAKDCFDLPIQEEDMIEGSEGLSRLKKQYKTEYHRGKNGCNFPIVYGSSAPGVAHRQGVTKEEAQRWIDTFHQLYPGVGVFVKDTQEEVMNKKFVRTLMGRKRRFPNYDYLPWYAPKKKPSQSKVMRQAVNFKIQGMGADIAKIAGARILKQFKLHPEWRARILLIVHDEYVVECLEEKYVDEVKNSLINSMTHAVCLGVPFTVDCKVGDNYSEIK